MFTIIESLEPILQCLSPAFTQPSFQTHLQVFLGWVMCLGKRTEFGVFRTIQADTPVSRNERHPFDRFYNFFGRSAWTVQELARQVAVAVVVGLNPKGLLYLVVDDTLLHKRGKRVYALGWFRDAVASTAKRVATAIEAPQHWCRESIEKLSPWVWPMQSVVSLWYLTQGRNLPQARAARRRFGAWDTEWSLAHMIRVLRAAILDQTITPTSATKADLQQLLIHLENYLSLAT
jgi:hypothetical protein